MVKSKFYNLDTDKTLSSNSDYYVPSEKAIKTYVDTNIPTVNDATLTIQKNGTTVNTFTANASSNVTANITVPTTTNELTNNSDFQTGTQVAAAIAVETGNRESADNNLQSQIDAIVSASDVFDIVGTYAELQAYDISTVPVNDIIKVLVDSSHSGAATYYRCIEINETKSWSYIGSEGAYYTKAESDSNFVPQTRTINSKALSSNITLTASDVGALPSSTVIPTVNDSTITIQKNGSVVDTFTLNQSSNKSIDITVPTATSNLTNDSGFITSADLPTNHVTTDSDQNITGTKTFVGTKKVAFKQSDNSDKLGFTLYAANNTEKGYLEFNPSNTIDSAPLMTLGNYATSTAGLTQIGFRKYSSISGANGAYNLLMPMIADARTPFNLTTTYTNFYLPLGYTNGNTTVTTAKSGLVDISTLLPTVGNGTITINQGGTQKGTFTVNQSGDTTINLNDGGGIVDQTYNASSTNAQSGTAVAEALTSKLSLSNSGTHVTVTSSGMTLNTGEGSFNVITDGFKGIGFDYSTYGVNLLDEKLWIQGYDSSEDVTITLGDTSNINFNLSSGSELQYKGEEVATVSQIPTTTSDLTNDSGFITNSALTGYATETFVTNQGYITGISSSDVTTALGYTPYNSSNPAGYTSNVGTVTSINNTQPDATGNVSIIIPAAQVNSDWNAQSGVAQILNKPTIPTMTYNSSTKTLTWS